jgi:tetratricopeptide (TPR) repeat protein
LKVQDLKKKLPTYGAEQRMALLKFAVEEFESKGDQPESAHTLLLLGNEYRESGQPEDAALCFSKGAETFGKLGDLYGEAASLNNLGFVNKSMGEINNALNSYEKALSIYRNLRDKEHENILLLNIAKLYYSMGEHLEAIEYFEDSLEASDTKADTETLYALGNSYSKANDHVRALEYLEKALLEAKESGDRETSALTLRAITGTYLGMGDGEKAGIIVADYKELLRQPNPNVFGKFEPKLNTVDLAEVVLSALKSCSDIINSKNINAIFKASADEIIINSDREMLLRILCRLISTAVEYTPIGKNIYAYVSADGASARCEMIDEGSGLSEVEAAELFSGDTDEKSLARLINGELRCEGMLGKGSAYVLEFKTK